MKRIALIAIILLIIPASNHAQNLTNRFFFAYADESLTIDNTSGGIGFTASKITSTSGPGLSAQSATFTINCTSGTSCPIRMTIDGTAPTTTVGLRADYGQSVTIYAQTNIVNFRAIREGSTSAKIDVSYAR
jgi:hypothetical protein